jgi:hypothetical protein
LRCLQVLLPTSSVKSYSPEDGASKSGSKISYAELGRQAPWAVQELKVHFHHDKPFKRVSRSCCRVLNQWVAVVAAAGFDCRCVLLCV